MYGWEEGSLVPRYALVAIDNFSKKLAAVPRKYKDKGTLVLALESVVKQLGKPLRFVCNEGPGFDNDMVLSAGTSRSPPSSFGPTRTLLIGLSRL